MWCSYQASQTSVIPRTAIADITRAFMPVCRLAKLGREALCEHILEQCEPEPLLRDELRHRLGHHREQAQDFEVRALDLEQVLR